ncbi:helix-turn-helix transcriptional regulator [Streptomyces sp. WMMC897]|nr:helix-turn-helix transcriptional regulator [Streptomyces sp. WMMC897]MCZ7414332.1 helix-turn-helix transcriptional regulator [Streptomyces sp. WMMC897]
MPARSVPPSARTLQVRRQVGRNIAALRLRRNLTQERLAERAELSAHSIYRTELGTRSPRLDWLIRIADALDVTLAELVREPPE